MNAQPRTWAEGMQAFARHQKITLQDAVKEQARLLVIDLIKLTPPTSSKGVFKEGGQSQKMRGRAMIEHDMRRQFMGVSEMKCAQSGDQIGQSMRKYIAEGDMDKLRTIIERISSGTVRLITEASEGLHDLRRNPRNGRPTKQRHVVLNEQSITDTIKRVQTRVGYGKSGWLQSLNDLGNKSVSGYGFIRAASKRAGGYTIIALGTDKPSVTVANAAPHGANLLKLKSGDNLLDRAIRIRANKIMDRIAFRMRAPKGSINAVKAT